MTNVSDPGRVAGSGPGRGADAAMTVTAVVLDALALAVVGLLAFVTLLGDSWPGATEQSGDSRAALTGLAGVGAVAVLAALSAAFLRRRRLPGSARVQVIVAALCALATVAGAALEARDEGPVPVPVSDDGGPGGACLSGGDNDECRGSGG
ncbi:DUF6234 family protein [Streptomyces sp. SBT349]|uniref:DUF6234 family protein n=1 Tax=Streptomyces sp. SBT349 TaxID=1580539 RepID=UPI00066DC17F|nr:DUF6234 family protein [Streptomyces sp. SBT349]